MPTRGVSGLGVTVAAFGAYLMYAAVQDVPLLQGARQLIRGEVPTSMRAAPQADAPGNFTGSNFTAAMPDAGLGASVIGDRLVDAARRYLGRPYVWGRTFQGTGGGDCSGLVQRSFTDAGVPGCPRTSGQIAVWTKLRKVPRETAAPGDVLWWAGHVAIAVSTTDMIEAPTLGVPVRIARIRPGALCLRYAGG